MLNSAALSGYSTGGMLQRVCKLRVCVARVCVVRVWVCCSCGLAVCLQCELCSCDCDRSEVVPGSGEAC